MAATTKRRRRAKIAGVVLLLTLAALVLDYFAYPYGAPLPSPSGNRGENGIWLRYTWYFGEHSADDLERLPRDLADRQVRYAYFHVRYIGKSGRLRFRYPENARRINARLHRDAPGVRSLAWVYIGNARGIGDADLSDPAFRRKAVAEAVWLVTACGFDGVQWDYEICEDGDRDLLALLYETRAALPPGKTLSVATALWSPQPFRAVGQGWGDAYFREIARRCDQIAVMGYDSGLYLPRAYVALMREQVIRVSRAATDANPTCRVLIGVPTYGPAGASHHPHAENLASALRGVAAGYTRLTPRERAVFAGVAPFADYTTDESEWAAYRNGWLGR
jgi:hypothetical protein